MANKALLVDLDKTIRDTTEPDGHLTRLKTQFIMPKRIEILTKYKQQGYKIIGVTNAGFRSDGLSPPHVTIESIHAIQQETLELLKGLLDAIIYSPLGISPRRKPDPEMLLIAIRDHDIDKSQCMMIGDSWKDLLAAEAVGIPHMHPDQFFS